MITEIELKYSLLGSKGLAAVDKTKAKVCQLFTEHDFSFSYKRKELTNHYFDTENLSLSLNKIALRTRGTKQDNEGIHFEQTIKTSGSAVAGLHQRPEYNVDINDALPNISLFPHDIWQEGTNIEELQTQLMELFSTNFTRHTWLVTLADAQVEIALDYGDIFCQGHKEKLKIFEIELELVNGKPEALFVLTKILFTQLALRPGQLTKAARGYTLYQRSLTQGSQIKNKYLSDSEAVEQLSLSMMNFPKVHSIDKIFNQGVEFTLTQLQLTVDRYVEQPSLITLGKISELLALLRQGFWLFKDKLTDEVKMLRSELSYFIRTIHWVDNARFIDDLTNKQCSYQKGTSVNQELIIKLQLTKKRYPNESQVMALLHSERFNNLQLNLLSLLLKRSTIDKEEVVNSKVLALFAANHLTHCVRLLSTELTSFANLQRLSSNDLYITANSLLIRALLTISWFSYLFIEPNDELAKKFIMPWLDIKQGINELQSLNLLQEQLSYLPNKEDKLESRLMSKSENLITALDQPRVKALSMKPYWS
jgi:triphosphatase